MSDVAAPRFHDHNDEADQIGPPTLRPGGPIHLVQWTSTMTGWQPLSFTAIYVRRSKTEWIVTYGGETLRLPRATWFAYLP